MQLINKKEIFVDDLDEYFKDKKYKGELIGLYEPDYEDMELVIQKYAHREYKFILYFEHSILSMLIYNNFAIETSFTRFYNKVNLFAVYQYEEYYMFALKLYDTVFF